MEVPSSENAEHPTTTCNDATEQPAIISNDAEEKPTISIDAEEKPTISIDAEEKPTISIDAEEKPAISNDADEKPAISNDAAEHPTIISSDPLEHPTTISNDPVQHPTQISDDTDHLHENMAPNVLNDGSVEPNHDIAEEVKQTLEAIALTGKFWHVWKKLRSMLSFQLNQVLSLYPEANNTPEQRSAALGETFEELEKRLNEALFSFVEGPPFTLQRVCEILLEARSIYPNLSKLALALEKNLLVTSMLAISTDPYAQATTQEPDEPNKSSEGPELHSSSSVQNGIELEAAVGDRDEIMAEVEDMADIDVDMTIDMDALEGIVGSAETNFAAPSNSQAPSLS